MESRLKLSNQFSFTWERSGDTIVYHFSKPEHFCRLPEETRVLLSCFSTRDTISVGEAIEKYMLCRPPGSAVRSREVAVDIIEQLIKLGALTPDEYNSELYSDQMISSYIRSRKIPHRLVDLITREGHIGRETRVLDIGTGTGEISVQLGRVSERVIGIDISQPFLSAAKRQAQMYRSHVDLILKCGNRVIFDEHEYEVIVAAQSFHWLDRYWAVRGIYRVLVDQGSFFAVESKPILPVVHPFRKILGFGVSDRESVLRECYHHTRMYANTFLGETDQKPIQITGSWLFRQDHVFDMDFARAYFFTDQLTRVMSGNCRPWEELESRLESMPAMDLKGEMYWLVVKMQKCSKNDPTIIRHVAFDKAVEL